MDRPTKLGGLRCR